MAPVYLDSSILVSLVMNDPRAPQARTILGSRESCTSQLSEIECQAGLSFQFSVALTGLPASEQILNTILDGMQIIQLTPAVLNHARTLVRRHRTGLGLRTLDALHIASCAEMQAQFGVTRIEYITADRRQHNAFLAEGFSGTLLP
jgi:predicted nucleic acid-binding protein